jgi:hypothetical protein
MMNTGTDLLDIGWIILSEQPTCKTILPKLISMENNLTATILNHTILYGWIRSMAHNVQINLNL